MAMTSPLFSLLCLLTLADGAIENGIYRLRNVHSGLFLGVDAANHGNGANALQSSSDGDLSQWKLQKVRHDGVYTLQSVGGDGYLNVAGDSMVKGANVWLWGNFDSASSQWHLVEVPGSDTAYVLQNVHDDLVVNVAGGSMEDGANVFVWANPGSTSSQWELIGEQTCLDAVLNDACYNDTIWAKDYGIATRPEWYPGLTVNSTFADIQAHLNLCYWSRCPQPCASTRLHTCGMPDRFWSDASCADAVAGSQCQEAINWAMGHGIFLHPEWYLGLNETSNEREFQAHMFQNQQAECAEPCCHDTLSGELCYHDAMWAMQYGINLEDISHVYPPFFTNTTGLAEFQAYLHLCYPSRCPEPCADTEVQSQLQNISLDCPDVRP